MSKLYFILMSAAAQLIEHVLDTDKVCAFASTEKLKVLEVLEIDLLPSVHSHISHPDRS